MRTMMTDFDKIKEWWDQQPTTKTTVRAGDIIQKTESHLKKIRRNHIGTVAILAVVVVVATAYFIWVSLSHWSWFATGLTLMIGTMVWRIILELISMKRFSEIKPNDSFLEFSQKITAFYIWRKKVHLVQTPIIYLSYTAGFLMLLPTFKATMSTTLFWFCTLSGSIFLIVFGRFMIHLIRKEIKILDYLNGISTTRVQEV